MTNNQQYLYIIVGRNGTGKTTFCNKLVNETLDKDGRVLIITPHDQEWQEVSWIEHNKRDLMTFTGVRKMLFMSETANEKLDSIVNHVSKCLIVFDDCRAYFSALTPNVLERLFISRRQKAINLVVVGHSFSRIPPAFFTYCNYYVLFNSNNDITSRKNYINDFEAINNSLSRVRQIAETSNPYHYEIIKS